MSSFCELSCRITYYLLLSYNLLSATALSVSSLCQWQSGRVAGVGCGSCMHLDTMKHASHLPEPPPLPSSLPTTTSPTHIPHCFIAPSLQTPHHQHILPPSRHPHTHACPPALAHGRTHTHTHTHTKTGGHACDNGGRSHGRLLLPPTQGPGVCVWVCVSE